jgi:SAM-dependent methyltransferase
MESWKNRNTDYRAWIERERSHYNLSTAQACTSSLRMSEANIQRYSNPPAQTTYPLEFAFHLMGDLRGKTVLELGCGDGLNTVVLAALGASVIGVDISEKNLALAAARARANMVDLNIRFVHADVCCLPLAVESVDKALCAAILHHVDVFAAASEIHRVLKPAGTAVFLEPVAGPFILRLFKRLIPKGPGVTPDEHPLTAGEILAVNQLVGITGQRREFGLTYRVTSRMVISRLRDGSRVQAALFRASHRIDSWLLANLAVTRVLASPVV